MKICILTRSLPIHRTGGLETHTWDLATGLVRKNHTVHIITSAHPEGKESDRINGVNIHFVPNTKPAVYTPMFFPRLNRLLSGIHEKEKFDLVHSEGFAGLTFKPPEGLPLVATLHGTLYSETPLYHEYFRPLCFCDKLRTMWRYRWRIAIRLLYQKFLKTCDRIFVDSGFSRRVTLSDRRDIADAIRVVPLGIDVSDPPDMDRDAARKRLGLSMENPLFFTLSRIENMKGVDVALRAFSQLKRKDVTYIIGGEGRMRAELEDEKHEMGLDNVIFTGRISDDDLSDYFTAADVFIYPEISHPAFGLVSVEAMFHGAPVLGTDAGAIPEVVSPETGKIVSRGNPDALCEGMKDMLENIDLWRTREAKLREYVMKNYSLDRFLEDTLKVYTELVR